MKKLLAALAFASSALASPTNAQSLELDAVINPTAVTHSFTMVGANGRWSDIYPCTIDLTSSFALADYSDVRVRVRTPGFNIASTAVMTTTPTNSRILGSVQTDTQGAGGCASFSVSAAPRLNAVTDYAFQGYLLPTISLTQDDFDANSFSFLAFGLASVTPNAFVLNEFDMKRPSIADANVRMHTQCVCQVEFQVTGAGYTAGVDPGRLTSVQATPAIATVVATAPATVVDCPNGGVDVYTGLDDGSGGGRFDDGVLQVGERDTTQSICNGAAGATGAGGATGAAGAAALVQTSAEPAGGNCTNGGTKIEVGVDDGTPTGTAGDTMLQPGEIDSTSYVCTGDAGAMGAAGGNGTNGATGASGATSLILTSAITSSAECANGGVLVRSGVDDGTPGGVAGDGILDPTEVDSTASICNGAAGSGGCAIGGAPNAPNVTGFVAVLAGLVTLAARRRKR